PKPQFAQQQPRLLVEVERDQQSSGSGSLDDVHDMALTAGRALHQRRLAGWRRKVGDGGGRPAFQIRQNGLDLTRERQLRVDPGAIEIAADQLKLTDHVERRAYPAGAAVVGADLIAAVGFRLEE